MTVRKITNPTRYTGLANDVKPERSDSAGVEEGSSFYEIDTRRHYVFEAGHWVERPYAATAVDDYPLAVIQRLDRIAELLEALLSD